MVFWMKFTQARKKIALLGAIVVATYCIKFSARGEGRQWHFHVYCPYCGRDNNRYLGISTTPFFYKQFIFEPYPKNCLSFSKKLLQKIV